MRGWPPRTRRRRPALRPGDSQRLARAWEVWTGTGQGLAAWQREGAHTGPAPWHFAAILLDPPREALRAAIAARFDAMLAGGALAEVRGAAARSGSTPPCRRCGRMGCRNCWRICAGDMPLEAARERAVLNTGQYTKRQATWFRHHATSADPSLTHIIHARMGDQTQFQESDAPEIFAFLHRGR